MAKICRPPMTLYAVALCRSRRGREGTSISHLVSLSLEPRAAAKHEAIKYFFAAVSRSFGRCFYRPPSSPPPPVSRPPPSPPHLISTLSLGAAYKSIIREVKRRCPLASKAKKMSACSAEDGAGRGGGSAGVEGGAERNSANANSRNRKKAKAPSFTPGMLCSGARGLGLDLGGFQAVILAAAEVRYCIHPAPRSPTHAFIHPLPIYHSTPLPTSYQPSCPKA